MKKYIVLIASLSVSLLASFMARADLIPEITSWVEEPSIIAAPPVSYTGTDALSDDIASIIRNDLETSGVFKALDPKTMLSFPATQDEVVYRDWRIQKSDYLVIGQLNDAPNGYELTFSVFDVVTEKPIISNARIPAGKSQLRLLAHTVSNRIYEEVTGIRGAFTTSILYVSADKVNRKYRLIYADMDGARPRVLYSSNKPIMSPSWSPDARQVAYVSFETGRAAIFMQDIATGKRSQLTNFKGLNGAPVWSPDASKLAMVLSKDGNPEIYVLDIASRQLQRITNHFSIDTEPAWSADGREIYFTSSRGGRPQIYRSTLGASGAQRVTFEGDYNARPRITSDGKHMVMVNRTGGVFHIANQNLETGRVEILTQTTLDESPSIAPNDAMLIYATKKGGRDVLAKVTMDGKASSLLPSASGAVQDPAWSPFLN